VEAGLMRWNEWSGEPWFLNSAHSASNGSIQVIESAAKAAPAKKKKAKAKPEKVPFGFSREIPKGKKRKR
jgi:hypothetical protein